MIRLQREFSCDVLVIGGGLAGLVSAVTAAEQGCRVVLACNAPVFSGSSFYPGTWGLGLVSPVDSADEDDLLKTVLDRGMGMADRKVAETFIRGIRPAVEKLRQKGLVLKEAENPAEREFIPCFDRKTRAWHGLEADKTKAFFSQRKETLGIQELPGTELLEIVKDENRVCGALLFREDRLFYVACKALVLATGGTGGLFAYHVCPDSLTGSGQAAALKAGCRLTNMEFIQMMPAYVSPAYKTIFNEKTFRFSLLSDVFGQPLFSGYSDKSILEERSGHGPFTCRLSSAAVDIALYRAFLQNPAGVTVSYREEMKRNPPEFIRTYFDWLKAKKGLTWDDSVRLGIFAHAANGGIVIDENAATDISGLYACGEVTGMMHGADRLGGLSSANCIVLGEKAGLSAAAVCKEAVGSPENIECSASETADSQKGLSLIQKEMFENAMVVRSEQGLQHALSALGCIGVPGKETSDPKKIAKHLRLSGQVLAAKAILSAALLRKESRGSHFREDYPTADAEHCRRIEIRLEQGEIKAGFAGE